MNLGKSQPKLPAQQSTPQQQSQSKSPQTQTQTQTQTQQLQPATSHLITPPPSLSESQPEPLSSSRPRPLPEQDFNAIVQDGQNRRLTDPDVVKAMAFQAVNVGGGAAFAFGAGRAIGAGVAEMIVKAGFQSPQLAGVGPDTAHYHETGQQTWQQHTGQVVATAVARAIGATVGGGIGATVGNVVAPRLAAMLGKQFKPMPADVLVPDRVAKLRKPDGQLYGEAGVKDLREQVTAAHKEYGAIVGDAHVHAGQLAFGVENASRGLGQGKQPMGAPTDAGVSIGVSGTAGAVTGIYAAIKMAGHRLSVPNPDHTGTDPAPMVDVPTFYAGDPAPIPDRFTGPTVKHTAMNIAAGTGDRIGQMAKATWPLSAANVAGTVIAAAIPKGPSNIAHRVVQAVEAGPGVAAAVRPWFESQPNILNKDKARIARQQPSKDLEMQKPKGGGPNPEFDPGHRAAVGLSEANFSATEAALQGLGMQRVTNTGSGANCLIISLLQHATGDYAQEHAVQAEQLRRELADDFPGTPFAESLEAGDYLRFDQALPARQDGTQDGRTMGERLVNRMAELHPERPLNVTFVNGMEDGGQGGDRMIGARHDLHPNNGISVAIFEQGEHFEALQGNGIDALNGRIVPTNPGS